MPAARFMALGGFAGPQGRCQPTGASLIWESDVPWCRSMSSASHNTFKCIIQARQVAKPSYVLAHHAPKPRAAPRSRHVVRPSNWL